MNVNLNKKKKQNYSTYAFSLLTFYQAPSTALKFLKITINIRNAVLISNYFLFCRKYDGHEPLTHQMESKKMKRRSHLVI